MTLFIAPIVEGHTEQGCVERLLQRVWHELLVGPARLQVLEPFRGHRDALTQTDGKTLSSTVQKAALKLRAVARKDTDPKVLLLILLDAESECPAKLAPRLLHEAKKAIPSDIPVACVLAKRMLENWIVAGSSTLAGVNGLPNVLPSNDDPERCHGVGWLSNQLRSADKKRKYTKTADAMAFIAAMDLKQCRDNAPSFDKLCRHLESCLPPPPAPPPPPTAETESPADPHPPSA